MARPIPKLAYLILFTLIFSGAVNLITALPGGASLPLTLPVILFMFGAATGVYQYGLLRDACEREVDGEIAYKRKMSKDGQVTPKEKKKIEATIFNRERKRFSRYGWMLSICLVAAAIQFVVLVNLERKRNASERSSREDYRARVESGLKTLSDQVDRLIKREDDFLEIRTEIAVIKHKMDTFSNLAVSVSDIDQRIAQFATAYEKDRAAERALAQRIQQQMLSMTEQLEYLISRSELPQQTNLGTGDVTENQD